MFKDVLARSGLAAPPGGDGGQQQFFAEQMTAQTGEEGHQTGRFQDAAADGVIDGDGAVAHGLHETGDAEQRVAAEFERVTETVVHTAVNDIDGLQAREGFQEHTAVADRKIRAFDEGEAPVAGEEGVFKIGFIVGTGGEEDDTRRLAAAGGHGEQGVAFDIEETGERTDVALVENAGEDAGADEAIFERVADTGGGLGAIAQRPPAAIGGAGEIDGVGLQGSAADGRNAVTTA